MKSKKSLIAIVGIVALLAVGGTTAYYVTSSTFDNEFDMASYRVETTEYFVSPNNWQPCDVTAKTVSVTNKSSVDVSVRIKLNDYWKDKNGNDLPDLVENGQKLTSINFHDGYENYWEVDGLWYVYRTNLPPNSTTQPLIDSVSLSCSANLTGAVSYSNDGKTAVTGDSPYADAKFHVEATVQTVQASGAEKAWDRTVAGILEKEENQPKDFRVDFKKGATLSNDIEIANGNGVNKYTEKGVDIYYYRGVLDNNNIIWGGYCWTIVRTTYTGGTKMIYNGVPTTVNGKQQCLATGAAKTMNGTTYRFNESSYSPAHAAYKYGDRIDVASTNAGASNAYIFSNDVSRNGDTYTLDTSDGQSISGTWPEKREEAAVRYHYFCTNRASSCGRNQIGYILYFGTEYNVGNTIYYLPVGGYDNIEAAKTAMFRNDHDSWAKSYVESWFSSSGLAAREDDLEDAIYCGDRTIMSGSLVGKDTDASTNFNKFSFNARYTADGVYEPSLECPNKHDSFTKSDTVNGNGQLRYKVGLLTGDELALSGLPSWANMSTGSTDVYIYTNVTSWTMTPAYYGVNWASETTMLDGVVSSHGTYETDYLRPVVSLKAGTKYASGTGSKTDPYIVE